MSPDQPQLSRRRILKVGATGAALGAVLPVGGNGGSAAAAPVRARPAQEHRDGELETLERRYGVDIGVRAVNLSSGASIAHRPDQRFPMLSTFKTLAVAAVLDRGTDLDEVVRYASGDVVSNSPVTGQRRRMTYGELCDAALRYSDNTAGNLLLRRIGGPRALTRYSRRIGDRTTRLDRWEPELNTAIPGDLRDTTTPAAIGSTYRKLLLGGVLSTSKRWQLRAWMQGNTTSVGRFRAGIPATWWYADKTGSGDYATGNDVGALFAPDGTTILSAVLTRGYRREAATDPGLMTDVARLISARLG